MAVGLSFVPFHTTACSVEVEQESSVLMKGLKMSGLSMKLVGFMTDVRPDFVEVLLFVPLASESINRHYDVEPFFSTRALLANPS